jgi:dihydrofolate reductase
MRKILVFFSVSLDGYFEGPSHELDWQIVDAELHQHFNDVLRPMGGFLDGRKTHELMAGYWPTADQDPKSSPQEVEFAGIWREMPKIAFSRTRQFTEWNTRTVTEVVPDEIRALKAQPGGDLVVGGANLAATFLKHDLIDEFRLYVHPVIVGRGTPLFPTSDVRKQLRLVETRPFSSGVVLLHYAA